MQLIKHALEGSSRGLPAPSMAALQEISKLTELELSVLHEQAKQEAKAGSARGHGRIDSFFHACGGCRGCFCFSSQFTDSLQAPPST